MESNLKINDWKKKSITKKEVIVLRGVGLILNLAVTIIGVWSFIDVCKTSINFVVTPCLVNFFVDNLILAVTTFSFYSVFRLFRIL